jgi:hypothetical protein
MAQDGMAGWAVVGSGSVSRSGLLLLAAWVQGLGRVERREARGRFFSRFDDSRFPFTHGTESTQFTRSF